MVEYAVSPRMSSFSFLGFFKVSAAVK